MDDSFSARPSGTSSSCAPPLLLKCVLGEPLSSLDAFDAAVQEALRTRDLLASPLSYALEMIDGEVAAVGTQHVHKFNNLIMDQVASSLLSVWFLVFLRSFALVLPTWCSRGTCIILSDIL
jgi:hypothetical protein